MKLWLLRHARVRLPSGLCYGISEVSADPGATEDVAQRFAGLPAPGSSVWVSPALRTQQLATALMKQRTDLRGPHVDERLREMDFGQWELQHWSEIPRTAIDAWTADFAHHRFGGNECTQDVIDRAARGLDAVLSQRVSDTVWITHAGVMRAVQYLVSGGPPVIACAKDWPVHAPAMGEWQCLEL